MNSFQCRVAFSRTVSFSGKVRDAEIRLRTGNESGEPREVEQKQKDGGNVREQVGNLREEVLFDSGGKQGIEAQNQPCSNRKV